MHTGKKNTFIFFRKCLCDLALLLISEGGWELDEHFHCPHTRCWRQLPCYRASTWRLSLPVRSSRQDNNRLGPRPSPNLPKMMIWILISLHLPRQHKWALAGNKLLNHLPFFWKGHQGVFVGQQDLQTVIFALDWFILKVVVQLVPHFNLPLSVAESFAKP